MSTQINERWAKLESPPASALREIKGGRIAGMTDINPQWRYKAMTEVYGECGVGWKWQVVKVWTEPGTQAGEVFAFVHVEVCTNKGNGAPGDASIWSDPVPGIGGAMLIAKEKGGLFCNDDAFKMATTDALSVALKFLGVGSLIYEGRMDGKNGNVRTEEIDAAPIDPNAPATITDVEVVRESKPSDKKQWRIYRVTLSDGRAADTFEFDIAEQARAYLKTKTPIHIETSETQYGTKLHGITILNNATTDENREELLQMSIEAADKHKKALGIQDSEDLPF